MAFSPDRQMVASTSTNKTIWLWNAASSAKKQVLKGHQFLAVAASPDGQTVASTSADKTIQL
ncbi:Pfs, NACHT and WD domain protein [Aspergillus lentulus]|nr:Pfs, NACHT and WD domain protein [Aspergillus lentulus]